MLTHIVNIVICYANEDEVLAYAKQLERQTLSGKINLCVVVNKCEKGTDYLSNSLDKLKISYTIVDPKQNLGYLNGLLYGYGKIDKECEWYVFSNTDIEIPDKFFFEKLFKNKYLSNDGIWVVGPSVFNPNKNSYSNPYLNDRPNKWYYILRICGMSFPVLYEFMFKLKSKISYRRKLRDPKPSCFTYAIHGSFMILKKELLNVLFSRSDWEQLYDEEQYIAEIVKTNNKLELYESNLLVLHKEGTSTGKIEVKNRYKKMKNSNIRILKEFY